MLEGPRVRLRPPRPEDAEVIFNWYQDPELVSPHDRYVSDSYESLVRSLEVPPSDDRSLAPRFVVERRNSPGPVGVVGHFSPHPVLESVELWYLVGDAAVRGQGLGREAVRLLIDLVFRTTATSRVGISCDEENLASRRLAEALGFRLEGRLRDGLFHHGRWHEVLVYGITRAEWAKAPRPA